MTRNVDAFFSALSMMRTKAGRFEDGLGHPTPMPRPALTPARPFWIRAQSGQRPVIVLRQALRMRAFDPANVALHRSLDIRIEGVVITRQNAPVAEAIVTRAAVNRLQFEGVTLDSGGHLTLNGSPGGLLADHQPALALTPDLGFADLADFPASDDLPEVALSRCIAGPIAMGPRYKLILKDSLIDDGADFAISATDDIENIFGPITEIDGTTILGRVRVRTADGQGGLFRDRLEARDYQTGCLSFFRFSGDSDRLPPHFASVFGPEAAVAFTSTIHGQPGYGQLNRIRTSREVLEDGPNADEMGAFGYQLNTHKWKNLGIRLREFTPVGIRPILASVT